MPSFNRVILLGNLTRDPVSKPLPSGSAVVEFGLAINRTTGKGDDKREEVTFVDCAAFGRTGEIVNQYCAKGNPLFVEGRLKLDQWEDKQGGGKRSKLSVIVENVQLMGKSSPDETAQDDPPRRPAASATTAPARPYGQPMTADQIDQDCPF